MAIALGSIGMSLDDFCQCTPQEFQAIYEEWHSNHVCTPWERTRFLACCILQPYSKKTLKATDVIQFQWDKKEEHRKIEASTKERFEELKNRVHKISTTN